MIEYISAVFLLKVNNSKTSDINMPKLESQINRVVRILITRYYDFRIHKSVSFNLQFGILDFDNDLQTLCVRFWSEGDFIPDNPCKIIMKRKNTKQLDELFERIKSKRN